MFFLTGLAFETGAWPVLLAAAMLLGLAAGTLTAGSLGLLGAMDAGEQRGALTSSFYVLAYPGMAMPLAITTVASISSVPVALALATGLGSVFAVFVTVASRTVATTLSPPAVVIS